jgi:hypothetical protein
MQRAKDRTHTPGQTRDWRSRRDPNDPSPQDTLPATCDTIASGATRGVGYDPEASR